VFNETLPSEAMFSTVFLAARLRATRLRTVSDETRDCTNSLSFSLLLGNVYDHSTANPGVLSALVLVAATALRQVDRSLNAVTRLEKGQVDSRTSTVAAIEKALTRAGIEFLPSDTKGEGVGLRSPKA